jgi:hypothetical protein
MPALVRTDMTEEVAAAATEDDSAASVGVAEEVVVEDAAADVVVEEAAADQSSVSAVMGSNIDAGELGVDVDALYPDSIELKATDKLWAAEPTSEVAAIRVAEVVGAAPYQMVEGLTAWVEATRVAVGAAREVEGTLLG